MFERYIVQKGDINEHMTTLRDLSAECTHVTEMGVRAIISSWAFLEGLKKGGKLVSIDIEHPKEYGGKIEVFEKACQERGVDFEFILGDTAKITIKKTDLLFIDTLHTGEHLEKELKRHASKAKKYIVLHDTVVCSEELMPVVEAFLKDGKWVVKHHYTNNNGLMVLVRA